MNKIIGIYKITSKINPDKIYIGSSINVKSRWSLHKRKLMLNEHHSPILQSHVNKYGIDDLSFELIETCNKEVVLQREQYYIDTLKPKLNICKIAGNHLGRKCSIESIIKMRIVKSNITEETRRRISISAKARGCNNRDRIITKEMRQAISKRMMGNKHNLGNKRSEETRRKMSISLKGKTGRKKGYKLSDETKLKMSIAKKGSNYKKEIA
jgi:group I intron endonuclease